MISLIKLRVLAPQLLLCVLCLIMYSLVHSPGSLVVVLSEAVFYIICGDFVSQFMLHGKKKPTARTQLLSCLLMPTFAIILLAGDDKQINAAAAAGKVKKEKYISILQNIVSVSLVMLIFYRLKIFTNEAETRKMLKKSKHHLGPGLARAFFR